MGEVRVIRSKVVRLDANGTRDFSEPPEHRNLFCTAVDIPDDWHRRGSNHRSRPTFRDIDSICQLPSQFADAAEFRGYLSTEQCQPGYVAHPATGFETDQIVRDIQSDVPHCHSSYCLERFAPQRHLEVLERVAAMA